MANILGVLSSVLRVPSSEMAIDEALNARYPYLEKSTIDDIKRRLIRAGWVKVELVNIDGQGIDVDKYNRVKKSIESSTATINTYEELKNKKTL
jgi:hypothetical protein